MASFTLGEILKAVSGVLLQQGSHEYCTGVNTDTRTISPGELFIALQGNTFDGHHFLNDACINGASMVIISERSSFKAVPRTVSVILVKNTQTALEALAHFYRMKFDIPVVAVTGSNGKTTTKNMIAALVASKLNVCATQKNFNNEIGLSLTLLSMTPETEACVVEMGMRGLGQIAELCRIAAPTIGVVTNVGTSHIGILGSQENIAKAKGELIESLPDKGIAILNEDDPYVIKMGDTFSGNIIGYGVNGNYTVHGSRIQYENNCTKYVCTCFDEAFKVKLNMLGIHNVYNALAAFAVGITLGIDSQKSADALSNYVPAGMRQKSVTVGGITSIEDCYNASPDSMNAAIKTLANTKANKKIAVLGDMLELGDYSKKAHYEVGQAVADNKIDFLLAFGNDAKYIVDGAKENGMKNAFYFNNKEELSNKLFELANKGDAVIFKASRGMKLEDVINNVYDRWEK